MKVLVLGASGIIGSHMRLCVPLGFTPIWARRTADALHIGIDLEDTHATSNALCKLDPDVIVNLAGESRTDEVQRDPNAYRWINSRVPDQLALWCDRNEAHLIHVSTQAVFGGANAPYGPDSVDDPSNVYGLQKYEAEHRVRKYHNWTIVRPTFVLGTRPMGIGRKNPLESMLEDMEQRQVDDRYFSPLFARDAAESIWKLVESRPKGATIHLGIPQRVSRYDIAVLAAPEGANVQPVEHDSFPGSPRPLDTTYSDEAWHCRTLVQGIEEARRDMESKKAMDIQDRAREIALFLDIPEAQALAKLQRGFVELHHEVTGDFRRANPQTDAGILNWYRTTEAYIWELSAYHIDEGYNYSGKCEGIVGRLNTAGYRKVLCLGDGIGDFTIAARRSGMDAYYHDLRGSRTAGFAAFRHTRHLNEFQSVVLTDCWHPIETAPSSFDAVVSLDFYEHMRDVEGWVRATIAALKPDGLLCAQNAFGCGSGPEGSMPMHLACNDRFEKDWDPLLASLGMIQESSNWYRKGEKYEPSGPVENGLT